MDRQAGGLRAGDALDVIDREQRLGLETCHPPGQPSGVPRRSPDVRDLAAALRVERRPVEDQLRPRAGLGPQLDLGNGLERLVLDAVAQDRDDAASAAVVS